MVGDVSPAFRVEWIELLRSEVGDQDTSLIGVRAFAETNAVTDDRCFRLLCLFRRLVLFFALATSER